MSTETSHSEKPIPTLHRLLPELESVYKDIHAHPELSMQENRTSRLAADRLRAAGYEVTTAVGKTGVVGLLRNGAFRSRASHASRRSNQER
jgi:hippurate hydrolase